MNKNNKINEKIFLDEKQKKPFIKKHLINIFQLEKN